MRITYITAGAGGMYCGSCIRDNALARALIADRHDVLLVPMYTPTLTDEDNVSAERVFFGGVSVYLEQHLSLFRHTPWVLDRLWDAKWLLQSVSGRGVQVQPERLGELVVSVLQGRQGHQAKEIDKLVHWLQDQPRPDVVDLSNSMLIALAKPIKEALGVPVCCTLQGEDIFLDQLHEPFRQQAVELIQESLTFVDRFIAVSDYNASNMCRYLGIPGAKIDVVPLGVDAAYEPASGPVGPTESGDPCTIGYFGRIAPEKGTHLLCETLKRLRDRDAGRRVVLKMAGYVAPEHAVYVQSIRDQAKEWGLEADLTIQGTLEWKEKLDFLRSLDIFVVPAMYDDPKGLSLLEAMACGVPVVAPRRGTYTELLERTGGGVLVRPDDLDAFVDACDALVNNPPRRHDLATNAVSGVREHYTVTAMAQRAVDVYTRLA